MNLKKTLPLKIFRRLLDLGIAVYLIMIPLVIITGGFKVEFLGISVKANHLYTPLKILLPLILVRLLISVEIRNLVLLAVSTLIALAAAEAGMRVWGPPLANPGMGQIHRPSPLLSWELSPGTSGHGSLGEFYQINSAGFRDLDLPVKKRAGIQRIMVIGDSFTFGMGVDLKDTYAKQLEGMLNGSGLHSEVINCGVIGYNMWQHYETLRHNVIPYKPDLVILGLFPDDLFCSFPPKGVLEEGYAGHNPFGPRKGLQGAVNGSSLWNFLRNANTLFEYKNRHRRGHAYVKGIEERKKSWGPGNPDNPNYRIMSGRGADKGRYRDFSASLERFVNTAKRAGARTLVVMIPDSVQLNDPHMQAVNRYVRQVCKDMGVPFVDATPALEAQEDHPSLYLFPVDAHNSPRGLKVIAEAIVQAIRQMGLLSS